MTINKHWGYNKADDNWKSPTIVVRNLINIVSKGGNYLLNVGPTSEGLLPPPSVESLQGVGEWLKANGEAIYGAAPTVLGYELGKPGKPDSRGRRKSEGARLALHDEARQDVHSCFRVAGRQVGA